MSAAVSEAVVEAATKRLEAEKLRALMKRHSKAMQLIKRADDVEMRWRMLGMVVCPDAYADDD